MIWTPPFTKKANLNCISKKVDAALTNFHNLFSTRQGNYYWQVSLQGNICSDKNNHPVLKVLYPTKAGLYIKTGENLLY